MSTISTIRITSADDMSQVKVDTLSPKESIESLAVYLNKLVSGCGSASVDMEMTEAGGAAASGTVTFSSLANNDTVTVGTVTFTAKTSGASGNAQFNLGADDTAAATAFAAKVNAHPSLAGVVTASASAAVTTITAARKLAMGNMVALAISAHGTVSGSTLSGGSDPTAYVMHAGL